MLVNNMVTPLNYLKKKNHEIFSYISSVYNYHTHKTGVK